MKRFAELYYELDGTSSTSAKLHAVVECVRGSSAEDAAWAVALFLGRRPKGTASSRVVSQLAMDTSGVPAWLFEECRAAVGELAETVALLLPDTAGGDGSASLSEVIREYVEPLAGADDETRAGVVSSAFARLPSEQRYVYLKLIRGRFRVGVQRRLLARALAEIAGVEPAVMEHRLSGGFVPSAAAYERLMSPEADSEAGARPFPFFLASQLEVVPPELGDCNDWIAEWKWDGIRAQLIRRGDTLLWSRGDELITHQFPEIVSAAALLPEGTVLDGEILMWSDDRPLPFSVLQRRLNRKTAPTPQLALFRSEAPVFMAFDALEDAGEDIRSLPTVDRRARLETVVAGIDEPTIRVSPVLQASSWQDLAAQRELSRSRGVEGVMLKHAMSPYLAGRVRPTESPGWWKWKVDPYTVDAVLVYAYPGTGRRATLYTDYAFAVWGGGESGRVLLPFTRAYSGLDQSEIEALDAWIRRNTMRTMGPAREVKPERVFEIGFEGIAESPRHKAGVAVRFPRILRERDDKSAEDADTIESLRALLRIADPE